MTLVPYRNRSLIDDVGRAFARDIFNDFFAPTERNGAEKTWSPAVDIKETEESFVVTADIPGVDPKEIDITVDGNVLTIKGERKSEEKSENDGYHRIEKTYGSFVRHFTLPDTVNTEDIQAKGEHGVLKLVLPKQEKVKPKKIDIQ